MALPPIQGRAEMGRRDARLSTIHYPPSTLSLAVRRRRGERIRLGAPRFFDHHTRTALDTLVFQPMVGCGIVLASARNYRALRARGATVHKTIDMLIATFCMENGYRLLHSDEEHLGLRTL